MYQNSETVSWGTYVHLFIDITNLNSVSEMSKLMFHVLPVV